MPINVMPEAERVCMYVNVRVRSGIVGCVALRVLVDGDVRGVRVRWGRCD